MRKILLIALFAGVAFPALASNTVVTESNIAFDRESVTIAAGDTIVFANKDNVTHDINILGEDGKSDDKGLQKPGQEVRATLTRRGEYKVYCAINPKMKMTVMVQ